MQRTQRKKRPVLWLVVGVTIGALIAYFASTLAEKTLTAIFGPAVSASDAASEQSDVLRTGELSLEHETKFGGVYIHSTIEDFCDLGFEYGDAVDVSFSNGEKLENIPFYNGYYVRTGDPILVAYPGYPYIKAGYNNGEDMFTAAGLDDSCTAVVTLRERGTYLDVQNTLSMVYTNERDNYETDEAFANFRAMNVGNLKKDLFWRAASPCDDQYSRAAYSSALCEKAGVRYILDLADDADELAAYNEADKPENPYWRGLYAKNRVLPLDMAANYRSEDYAQKTAEAMRAVIKENGPYLIHCTEGKDRTGFVCILVEAFAGATEQQLERDYMVTYDNYYGVNAHATPVAYKAVRDLKYAELVSYLCGTEDIGSLEPEQLVAGAEKYLRFGGMTDKELEQLRKKITQ